MTATRAVDKLSTMQKALRAATPTLLEVAGWLRVAYPTVRAYSTGDRKPTPETVTRFASALRKHARRLGKLADQLERGAK